MRLPPEFSFALLAGFFDTLVLANETPIAIAGNFAQGVRSTNLTSCGKNAEVWIHSHIALDAVRRISHGESSAATVG